MNTSILKTRAIARLAACSAALGAVALPAAANATEIVTQFSISGDWHPFGSGEAYGLSGDPTLTGSFTLTDGVLTSLSYVTGSKSWSISDVVSQSFYQGASGTVYNFSLIFTGSSNFVHGSNTASINEGGNGLFCNGCVRFSSSPVSGAVPEPATWALMLVGFGALGSVMRLRRRPAALAA